MFKNCFKMECVLLGTTVVKVKACVLVSPVMTEACEKENMLLKNEVQCKPE